MVHAKFQDLWVLKKKIFKGFLNTIFGHGGHLGKTFNHIFHDSLSGSVYQYFSPINSPATVSSLFLKQQKKENIYTTKECAGREDRSREPLGYEVETQPTELPRLVVKANENMHTKEDYRLYRHRKVSRGRHRMYSNNNLIYLLRLYAYAVHFWKKMTILR